jgi:hypothetical protein
MYYYYVITFRNETEMNPNYLINSNSKSAAFLNVHTTMIFIN